MQTAGPRLAWQSGGRTTARAHGQGFLWSHNQEEDAPVDLRRAAGLLGKEQAGHQEQRNRAQERAPRDQQLPDREGQSGAPSGHREGHFAGKGIYPFASIFYQQKENIIANDRKDRRVPVHTPCQLVRPRWKLKGRLQCYRADARWYKSGDLFCKIINCLHRQNKAKRRHVDNSYEVLL